MDEKEAYDLKPLVSEAEQAARAQERLELAFRKKQAKKVCRRIAQIRREVEALNDRLYEALDLMDMIGSGGCDDAK